MRLLIRPVHRDSNVFLNQRPTLISWIAGKLDAVCDVFHCNSAAIQQAEDGLLCDLCEKAVGGITDLLNNYNVSGYVEDFLDANL